MLLFIFYIAALQIIISRCNGLRPLLYNLCNDNPLVVKYSCYAISTLCRNNYNNINTVKYLNGEEVIHQLAKSGNSVYKRESRKALEIISGKKSCCILM